MDLPFEDYFVVSPFQKMSEFTRSADDHGGNLLLNLLSFLLSEVFVVLVKSRFPMSRDQKHEIYHLYFLNHLFN